MANTVGVFGLGLAMGHTRQKVGAFTEQRGAISASSAAVYCACFCTGVFCSTFRCFMFNALLVVLVPPYACKADEVATGSRVSSVLLLPPLWLLLVLVLVLMLLLFSLWLLILMLLPHGEGD